MEKESLYEPFEIVFKTTDESSKSTHQHTFFELVYVLEGTGTQVINQNKFRYHHDHMFLITPEDAHTLEVESTTSFFFLRFNEIFLKSNPRHFDNIQRLEYILQNASHQPGCILKNVIDKKLVRPIIEAIEREYTNRDVYNKELITQLVNTLIVVVARNIARYMPTCVTESTEAKAMDILHYIQTNIYYPEKLRAEALSEHFGISESYLGRYFKKQTNETMQQYITNYRARLIEVRLQRSDMRMNEIASEMGFTDESHLNKFFRKHKGMSPTAYRKRLAAA
jgi:AraC-like DNA-binding protein